MAVRKPKKQNLKSERDSFFEKLTTRSSPIDEKQKLLVLSDIVSLSKKIGNPSDNYEIWITYRNSDDKDSWTEYLPVYGSCFDKYRDLP